VSVFDLDIQRKDNQQIEFALGPGIHFNGGKSPVERQKHDIADQYSFLTMAPVRGPEIGYSASGSAYSLK
jgi:hypothetical protein